MLRRYQAAEKLLTQHTRSAVRNGAPAFRWEGGVLTWTREMADGSRALVRCSLDGCESVSPAIESAEPAPGEKTFSPDGKRALFSRDHDLWLLADGRETRLTFDGAENCEYGSYLDIYSQVTRTKSGWVDRPLALFSPDGRYFVTYRADLRAVKTLPVVESCGGAPEALRPVVHSYACPFAVDGDDAMPDNRLYLGDAEAGTLRALDVPPYVMPLFTSAEKSYVRWLDDSSGFWCTWLSRDYRDGRLYFVDARSGAVKLWVQETAETFLDLGAFGLLDGYGSYQFSNFVTADRRYAFWQSERSGFAHLYRYDADGVCEGDLFGPEYSQLIVQKILRVDEAAEKIYFMANNVPGWSDPLYYGLFSVGFDGSGLTLLTPEDACHSAVVGPHGFADTYSRVDAAPVSVLRRLDGGLVRELERADISRLLELGYIMPERFTVTADDGETELYGVLVRPADFDPKKRYPVIDYVYGGAQLYNVPRCFTWDNAMDREILGGLEEFAQLGFVGVIIDGRGTPGRGRKFHDYSWKNIHCCAGLTDHPGALRRLAERFPFIDLDRVGIWGNSGGGYATVSALCKFPDFYKVGVASSGNYDQRVYENSWTERYYGRYDPAVYAEGDITAWAGHLRGKLLLACGGMDDNVTMWQTLRLCDELARRNKDYSLIVLPRVNHNVPADLYFVRRKMDFFVRHLLEKEPPKEFRFDCQNVCE